MEVPAGTLIRDVSLLALPRIAGTARFLVVLSAAARVARRPALVGQGEFARIASAVFALILADGGTNG
jgi:hypothetical protein